MIGGNNHQSAALSPSVWRVWIEIVLVNDEMRRSFVTLRVEGVD